MKMILVLPRLWQTSNVKSGGLNMSRSWTIRRRMVIDHDLKIILLEPKVDYEAGRILLSDEDISKLKEVFAKYYKLFEPKYQVTCGRCGIKISGPDEKTCRDAFRGHDKEVHNWHTGDEWFAQFEKELIALPLLDTEYESENVIDYLAGQARFKAAVLAAAKKVSGVNDD